MLSSTEEIQILEEVLNFLKFNPLLREYAVTKEKEPWKLASVGIAISLVVTVLDKLEKPDQDQVTIKAYTRIMQELKVIISPVDWEACRDYTGSRCSAVI